MDRQWTVAGAAALLSLENVAVLGGLLFRAHTSVVLLGLLLLKFPLCRALLRLRIAAAARIAAPDRRDNPSVTFLTCVSSYH
jgi:hypothetical protein